jgi:hypothetical protein
MTDDQNQSANGASGVPPKPRTALQMGLFNYVGNRWGPKDPKARFVFDIAIWIPPLLVLAILVKLSQG